ncbi:hypothetical protein HQ587_09625, partial [bacterium]|nr:hypothetical protein [bacterium]
MRFQSLLKTLVFLVIIMMVIPASAQFREIERIDLRNLNFEGLYGIATHHEAERIYVLNFRADVIFILNEEMDDVIDQIALQEPNTIYGMDFNVGDNTFWLADRIANPQIIYHYDLDGELLDDFQAGGAANSVTFCPENGHLYVVCHPGGIIELTVEGEEVDRFQGNLSLTAVDYYPPNGTLIIMDGADRIYEYSLEGELIETIMQQDAIEGNGLGLDYDPWTRTLYTTGQEGVVQIWEDNYSALPEPQIEPEAIQAAIGFGLDGEETLTITNVGEEESNLRFSLNDVGEGVDWL